MYRKRIICHWLQRHRGVRPQGFDEKRRRFTHPVQGPQTVRPGSRTTPSSRSQGRRSHIRRQGQKAKLWAPCHRKTRGQWAHQVGQCPVHRYWPLKSLANCLRFWTPTCATVTHVEKKNGVKFLLLAVRSFLIGMVVIPLQMYTNRHSSDLDEGGDCQEAASVKADLTSRPRHSRSQHRRHLTHQERLRCGRVGADNKTNHWILDFTIDCS